MNDFRTYWTCLNRWAIPVSSYDLSKHPKRIFKVWKPTLYLQCVLNPFHVHHGIVCSYMIYCMQLISLLANLLLLMWRHSFWAFMVWFLLVTHSDVKLNKFLTPAPLLRKTLQLSLTSFSGLNIVAHTHTNKGSPYYRGTSKRVFTSWLILHFKLNFVSTTIFQTSPAGQKQSPVCCLLSPVLLLSFSQKFIYHI